MTDDHRSHLVLTEASVPACVRLTDGEERYFDLEPTIDRLSDSDIAALLTGNPTEVDNLAVRASALPGAVALWVDVPALVGALANERPWLVGLDR